MKVLIKLNIRVGGRAPKNETFICSCRGGWARVCTTAESKKKKKKTRTYQKQYRKKKLCVYFHIHEYIYDSFNFSKIH